jgi:transcriptional regulator with XRE-family HTH domain
MRALKKLRLLLDIGQQELARASGLSTRELARIEAGEQLPRRETALGVDAGFDAILRERLRKEEEKHDGEDEG